MMSNFSLFSWPLVFAEWVFGGEMSQCTCKSLNFQPKVLALETSRCSLEVLWPSFQYAGNHITRIKNKYLRCLLEGCLHCHPRQLQSPDPDKCFSKAWICFCLGYLDLQVIFDQIQALADLRVVLSHQIQDFSGSELDTDEAIHLVSWRLHGYPITFYESERTENLACNSETSFSIFFKAKIISEVAFPRRAPTQRSRSLPSK